MQEGRDPEDLSGRLIEVPVTLFQDGMYVAALDRPWVEAPFMRLKGRIDIRQLQGYCRSVYVDPQRSDPSVQGALLALQTPPAPSPAGDEPNQGSHDAPPTMEQELRRASRQYAEARLMVRRLMRDEQSWHRHIPQVKDTVGRFAESIIANPSALVWLTRLKDRNEYTAEHCLNVSVLAMAFGHHLGYERSAIEELGLAGMLHDVGKMRVDPAILDKPGALSDAEFEHIRSHVLEGFAMLSDTPDLPTAVKHTCRDHHERTDGSGYPYGKGSEDISEAAKVIAIVDTYDAITSERVYSPARRSSRSRRCWPAMPTASASRRCSRA